MAMTSALSIDLVGPLTDIPLGTDADITRLANGGYAVIAEMGGLNISLLRIFDAQGNPVRSLAVAGTEPAITGLSDGRIVLSLNNDLGTTAQFLVSADYLTITAASQPSGISGIGSSLAARNDGSYVWGSVIRFSSDNDFHLGYFDAAGSLTLLINVENSTQHSTSEADVAVLSNNNVVTARRTTDLTTGDASLICAIYDPNGQQIGSDIIIPDSAGAGNENTHPRVAATPGGFAVVYSTRVFGFTQLDIRLKTFDLAGVPTGDFLITNSDFGNTGTDDGFDDIAPEIAVAPDGNIAITWTRTDGADTNQMLKVLGQGQDGDVGFSRLSNPQTGPIVTFFGTGQIAAYHSDGTLAALMGEHFSGFRDSFGDAGDDTYVGDDFRDLINGLDGNDVLSGGNNNDTLQGGDGRDTLNGDDGNDEMVGEEGAGALSPGDHSDHMYGGNGNDTIAGESGNDWIQGDAGTDMAYGGIGNDTLFGGSNGDYLYGGDHNDYIQGDGGRDWIEGGSGNDLIYGGTGLANDTLDHDTIYGGTGKDSIQGNTGNDVIFGDSGVDDLYGALGNDYIDGGVNTDSISGAEGNDTLIGGDGNDNMSGGSGNDSLDGGLHNDIIDGGTGNDTAYGGTGNDMILGDAGQDSLFGDAGNDSLNGGDNQDTLTGGDGRDVLTGGGGNDRFVFTSALAVNRDSITDFVGGSDKLALTAAAFAAVGASVTGSELRQGGTALDGNDFLLYVQATGVLSWDADADGSGTAQQIAQLVAGTVLAAGDFLIL